MPRPDPLADAAGTEDTPPGRPALIDGPSGRAVAYRELVDQIRLLVGLANCS